MNDSAPDRPNLDPVAFPILSPDQIEILLSYGRRFHVPAGDPVIEPGMAMEVLAIVSGEMEVTDGRSGRHIATHRAGEFAGDIDVISGRPTFGRAVAATDLELIRVPNDAIRRIVGERSGLGDLLLRAMLRRRALLHETGAAGVLVVGSRRDPATHRVREFLVRNRFPISWDDPTDEEIQEALHSLGVPEAETPVVVLPQGEVLRRPSIAELGAALGALAPFDQEPYDLVVVGAGPGGLAAAVYGASEGLRTLVLDAEAPGGQAGTSSRIENYMGFPMGISGQDLAHRATMQAERFGARFAIPSRVVSLSQGASGFHRLRLDDSKSIEARCVVLAMGARYQKIEAQGIDEFEGCGVFYAATHVERMTCGKAPVAIVGAGNSAGQAAVFMAETSHVDLVVRGDDLRKSMSSYLVERLEALAQDGRVGFHLNSEICRLDGQDSLESATVRNRRDGRTHVLEVGGVFVMIGASPCTGWLREGSSVALDAKGFVLTGRDAPWTLERAPFFLETSSPGVFAVGDVRSGSIKRVASAVGEGSMAVALAHQFLAI